MEIDVTDTVFCPHCGAPNEVAARLCEVCHQPMSLPTTRLWKWAKFLRSRVPSPVPQERRGVKTRIIVEENLHYSKKSGTLTYDLKAPEGTGVIRVIVSEQTKSYPEAKGDHKDNTVGYVVISNYGATSWSERFHQESKPIGLPVRPSLANKHDAAVLKFNYEIDPQANTISAQPIILEAQVADDWETQTSFLNRLRLHLTIESEVSSEVTSALEQNQEQILNVLKKGKEEIEKQIRALRKQSKRGGETTDADELAEALEDIERRLQDYQTWLDHYQRRHRLEDDWSFREIIDEQKSDWSKLREIRKIIEEIMEKFKEAGRDWTSPSLDQATELLQQVPYPINLAYIGINTPYMRRAVMAAIGDDRTPINWHYNPERQCLELRDQVLTWNSDTKLYETRLHLDIDPPTDGKHELKGFVVLSTEQPISGLQVEWTKDKGTNVDDSFDIAYRSWLTLDYTMDLKAIFSRRAFRIHRQLHFEGVVPHKHLVDNIKHILSNHCLTVVDDFPLDGNSEECFRHGVLAICQGAYEDMVGIKIDNRRKEGKRTIRYNEDREQLEEDVTLGVLDIDLIASMKRTSEKRWSKEINDLLSSIQLELERYLVSATEAWQQES
jgi:hypothetical protein